MMHHWDGGWGVGHWLLMGFGMLVFWGLVVAGIVWLVHNTAGRPTTVSAPVPPPPPIALDKPADPGRTRARDILDERYARGEIGEEEYRTRRDTLGS